MCIDMCVSVCMLTIPAEQNRDRQYMIQETKKNYTDIKLCAVRSHAHNNTYRTNQTPLELNARTHKSSQC